MEQKAERLEQKVNRKLAKRGGALAPLGYKKVWVLATVTCLLAIPVMGGALSLFVYSFQMLWLFLQMSLILMAPAGMFLGSGAALILPALIPPLSTLLSVVTAVTASMLLLAPRSRSLFSLLAASLLPIANAIVALLPVRTVAVVESVRIFDPLRPLLEDGFFRPLIGDLFRSEFLDIVPKPFLVAGPVEVVVESAAPSPFLALKIALSIAALGVSAYVWHSEKDKIKGWLNPPPPALPSTKAVEPLGDADEEEEEQGRLAALKAWEEEYQMRPPPSRDPANWSQDDLAAELKRAGLDGCVEPLRKAKIDGRVALTLTREDEEEIREELGISRLGERRRLLLFFEDLRAANQKEAGKEGAAEGK